MSINYTSHKWGLQLMQQPGYNTLRRYNYMKIWGMPKGSCLFQAVSRTAGENVLLGVLGCVRPRPVRRVRRDFVSGEDYPNYASSVTRPLGLPPCEARNCIREGNLKSFSWKDLPRRISLRESGRIDELPGRGCLKECARH